jgi:hypothetical protein
MPSFPILSLPVLAFIFSQLDPPDPDPTEDAAEWKRLSSENILRFLRNCSVGQPDRDMLAVKSVVSSTRWIQAIFQIRTFCNCPNLKSPHSNNLEGLYCYRQCTHFFSLDDSVEFSLLETRYSLAMITKLGPEPLVNLIRVHDPTVMGRMDADIRSPQKRIKLQTCKGAAGLVEFQFEIAKLLGQWENDWNSVLDMIDRVLQVEVR